VRDLVLDPRLKFLAALAAWSAALLAILRSPAGQQALVAPFAAWHAAFALEISVGSAVAVDLSCSGSDVIALSIAALLAYPASWGRRAAGVAAALLWLACLNLARIVTLVNTVGSPSFEPLHTYVWPAAMIAGSAAFVFGWMWLDQRDRATLGDISRWWRMAAVTALLVVAYVGLAPWLLVSETLQREAMLLARAAAAVLQTCGLNALTGGSTLVVANQSFLVTPECVITPLMPVYLAWALTWPARRSARIGAVVVFVPLFVLLGFLRLLTVALPAIIGPPLFLTHGFYQFVTALLVVAAGARVGARRAAIAWPRLFTAALAAGAVASILLGVPFRVLVDAAADVARLIAPHTLTTRASVVEVQGALAIMPGFGLSLVCALTIALCGRESVRPLVRAIPLLLLAQVLTLVIAGEMSVYVASGVPVTLIRAVSILTPCLVVFAVLASGGRLRAVAHAFQVSRA
jgi:exosortase/archaeosortase family protein